MKKASLLLLLLAACASAPKAPPVVKRPPDAGVTLTCAYDRPAGYVNVEHINKPYTRALEYHELLHVAQVNLIGGCDAWNVWVSADPRNRVRAEAWAYCVSARVIFSETDRFTTLAESIEYHAQVLAQSEAMAINVDAARALIRVFCGADT